MLPIIDCVAAMYYLSSVEGRPWSRLVRVVQQKHVDKTWTRKRSTAVYCYSKWV